MQFFARRPVVASMSPADTRVTKPPAGGSRPEYAGLMERISRGDRDAFGTLFDRTADRVRDRLRAWPDEPDWVATVFAATYVEVWWLAGCHSGPDVDVVAWIDHIVERRIAEDRRPPFPEGAPEPRPRYVVLELAELLGRSVDTLRPC
jgi:hypothetical protein